MMVSSPTRAYLLGITLCFITAGLGACKGAPAFVCESSTECNPGGTCEGTGFCSFPDDGCSSSRRYSGYAGDGLSNTCVGEGGGFPDGRDPTGDGGGAFADANGPTGDAPWGGCFDVGGGTCLELPTEKVSVGAGVAPDFTCAQYVPSVAAAAIAYSGELEDPLTGTGAPNGTIQWFQDVALTDLVVEATANATGAYAATFPAGTSSPMQVRLTATGRVETLHWNSGHRLNGVAAVDRDFHIYSNANLSSIATAAGTTHTPGLDVVYGFTYDCDGQLLAHATAVLSSTSSKTGALPTIIPGPSAVYNGRPRAETTDSDGEGNFYFFRVPAPAGGAKRYLQVWGYLSGLDIPRGAYGMRLISELEVPARAGALIAVEAHHTEGPLAP